MNRTVWSSGWIPQARSEVNVLLSHNSNLNQFYFILADNSTGSLTEVNAW